MRTLRARLEALEALRLFAGPAALGDWPTLNEWREWRGLHPDGRADLLEMMRAHRPGWVPTAAARAQQERQERNLRELDEMLDDFDER